MFIRPRHVGAYAYSEACEAYRKNGKPMQRVIARWPAERSLADELDLCEVEIIDCKLWLREHELVAAYQPARLSDASCHADVRRRLRELRYGAADWRRRLARAQHKLPGLRKAARAQGIKLRTGKLPARVMLSAEPMAVWQLEDPKATKAAILLEMERRKHREERRAYLRQFVRQTQTQR